jgi:FKBP-type peptidyl-prolyl cis-trans isomerase SlpA
MSERMVGASSRVTLHFAIRLDEEHIIDSTFDKSPATFEMGDGNLLPGFERALLGLHEGDKVTKTISSENAFGPRNEQNLQEFDRSQFSPDTELSVGMMMSFADAQKNELPGVIYSLSESLVVVDFNHPLAGRDILFDVEILTVEPI